jgi:general secretion pathway protein K
MASAPKGHTTTHSQRYCRAIADESGMALVLTLLIVTLVAVVVLELNYLMRVEVHASTNFRDGIRSYYLAKSGIVVVKELLSRNVQEFEEAKNILLAGDTHTISIGEGSAAVRLIDEGGKINVNALIAEIGNAQPTAGALIPQAQQPSQPGGAPTASPWIQITQDLFQRLGIDPTLVGGIIDWIDLDDVPSGTGGVESNYYRGLEKPYMARNGAMETIAELRLIRGFTDEVLLKLGARRVGGIVDPATNLYLTTLPLPQGGGWRINLNTAPPALLASMTREVGQFADSIVQLRTQQRIEKITDLQQLGIGGQALEDFQNLGTLTSQYYTVEARGSVGDMVKQITSLIQIGGDQANQILSWRVY